ncbi:hypothetical protein C8Q77DRAFT_1238288 [Trametes polyzona]|nr:hypothetical protein C8Q77DRAFT_1238288 [Trametes polyzona]
MLVGPGKVFGTATLIVLKQAALCAVADSVIERIDNTDPRVVYTGTWTLISASADRVLEDNNYNNTLAFTKSSGAFATIKFNGTKISVYGMLANTANLWMESQYTLDQNPPVPYKPPLGIGPQPEYRVLFWQTANLTLGEHTLQVKNKGDQYWFDYLAVEVPDPGTASSNAGPASTSAPRISPMDSTASATPSAPSSSTVPDANTSSATSFPFPLPSGTSAVRWPNTPNVMSTLLSSTASATPAVSTYPTTVLLPTVAQPPTFEPQTQVPDLSNGAVVGIAVGGLLLGQIVLLITLWWWFLRRRQRTRASAGTVAVHSHDVPGGPEPGWAMPHLSLLPNRLRGDDSPSAQPSTVASPGGLPCRTIRTGLQGWRGGATRTPSTPSPSSGFLLTDVPNAQPDSHSVIEIGFERPGGEGHSPWTDTDAGIRLAGGPLDSESAASYPPNPPPYSSTFGSGEGHVPREAESDSALLGSSRAEAGSPRM